MDLYGMFAQGVGIVAMGFNILSYQQKTRRRAIGFQFFGSLLFALNFFLLGATVGAILNLVGTVRAMVYLNKEKLQAQRLSWLLGFVAVYLTSYLLTFTVFGKEPTLINLIVEFLPVVGMTATTASFRLTDAGAIRRFGLISSPTWLIYNIANFSIGAICCEVLSLGSILIGILRHDRKKAE